MCLKSWVKDEKHNQEQNYRTVINVYCFNSKVFNGPFKTFMGQTEWKMSP